MPAKAECGHVIDGNVRRPERRGPCGQDHRQLAVFMGGCCGCNGEDHVPVWMDIASVQTARVETGRIPLVAEVIHES